MKNLSLSKKLIFGFGVILIFMIASIVIAVFSISRISYQAEYYEKYTVPNLSYISEMKVEMIGGVAYLQDAMSAPDRQTAETALRNSENSAKLYAEALDAFKKNQPDRELDANIAELEMQTDRAMSTLSQMKLLLESDTQTDIERDMSAVFLLQQTLDEFAALVEGQAAAQGEKAAAVTSWAWILLIGSAIVCIVLSIVVVLMIRRSIMTPMNEIIATFEQVAEGDMTTHLQYESKDEFGRMAVLIQEAFTKQDVVFGDFLAKLIMISKGDLAFDIEMEYHGDFQKIKKAMEDTTAGLNDIVMTISIAADQVRTGAAQVSDGAQVLAAGSAQQASSIEELSASIDLIAGQAEENVANVKIANNYVEKATLGMQSGNAHMEQLTQAMADISTSSHQIANIIKMIEDIAFQTNILSLNAAVEAARAGSAGKGFAVVADEVRNLAAKSAEAANRTAELIQASVASVSNGTKITEETAKILEEVGANTLLITESFERVEKASAEQAEAIEQIKEGLALVSSIVQTNAATAEENSATSEEMSAQATTLQEEVGRFKLKSGNSTNARRYLGLQQEMQQLPEKIVHKDYDLGKY